MEMEGRRESVARVWKGESVRGTGPHRLVFLCGRRATFGGLAGFPFGALTSGRAYGAVCPARPTRIRVRATAVTAAPIVELKHKGPLQRSIITKRHDVWTPQLVLLEGKSMFDPWMWFAN